jgi:hypothetical protein
MEENRQFTYLRVGDGELSALIEWQKKRAENPRVLASSRLKVEDYARLVDAFERCDYLDTFERVPYSARNFHKLELHRDPHKERSPSPELSQIFFEWAYHELPAYVTRHRCLIVGAEAPLLSALLADHRYNASIGWFWPSDARPICARVRDDGRAYWENLAAIKVDLETAVKANGIDTLFVALSFGAKILCQEVSEALHIRCFDIGSVLRALTYSATPGHSVRRASHHPFYFRVPLDVFLDALEKAQPDLTTAELVVKAHAQLCFELMRKDVLDSFVPEIADAASFDPSDSNMRHFRESLRIYYSRFGTFLNEDAEGQRLAREFRKWARERGLGVGGKAYVLAKGARRIGGNTLRKLGLR